MQKVLLIFSIVFLCSTLCIAQKTINKTDFDHLVDYANCRYVMAFIKKHDAGNAGYFQTYQKNVEPKLLTVSLDNLEDVLSFADLQKLLNGNIPAQKLAEKIHERKDKYNDYQDDNSLINSLNTTSWYKIDLSQSASIIQDSMLAKFKHANKKNKNSNPVSEAEVVKTQTIQTSTQVVELQAKLDQLQQKINELKIDSKILDIQKSVETYTLAVFIVLFGIVIIAVLLFYFLSAGYIKRVTAKSKRLEQKFVVKGEFLPENSGKNVSLFEDKLQSLERKFGDLQEKFNKILKVIDSENKTFNMGNEKSSASSNEKFFKTKNGKILQEELSNSAESSFKVFNINNNEAKFEYCGGIVNSDFFDGVCQFQNNPAEVPNKTKIITTTPGVVKKDINGNWIVETLATIKFV
jgi:polyhydroxyalkanoate synthesis regulator phasin